MRLIRIGPGTDYSMMPVAENLRVRRRRAGHRQLPSITEIHTPPITDAERQALPQFTHHAVEAQDPNPLTQDEREFLAEYEEEQRLRQLPPAVSSNAASFHHQHQPAAYHSTMQHGQDQLQAPTPDHQAGAVPYENEHQSTNKRGQNEARVSVDNKSDDRVDGGAKFSGEELEAWRKREEEKGM